MTADGLIRVASPHPVDVTIDHLAAAARARGMSILARIDHAGGAAAAGLRMRPAEVLIFGSPLAGTPLMQAMPMTGIDLPLKALAWQDESGATWLGYNDPAWIARRHALPQVFHADIEIMAAGLAVMGREAVARDEPGK
jgi:uncharacterized protein (DUF302 family)